jgi:hypothetical protein
MAFDASTSEAGMLSAKFETWRHAVPRC